MPVCLYVPCGHLLGKSCPLGSRLWCLTVSLSLSHWYPGSGVVLDSIDSDLCIHTYFPKKLHGRIQRGGRGSGPPPEKSQKYRVS